jgi:hypothetical protein
MEIREYYTLSTQQLLELLCSVVHELSDLYESVGFLQSQELEQKRLTWANDADASIQARDRAASYSAATITSELYKVEANLRALTLERQLVERLIDGREHAT